MTDEHDADNAPSMVGRQLGRYTCLREIGAGGMAVLYLAQRTGAKGFTKRFALKRIKPKYAADTSFTRMFMREAKLSATLDHPNIAQVVDFGQDGNEHFIVMEYVHGPDLRRLIRASPQSTLPLECALSVATRVCAALHYAHEKRSDEGNAQGLVHRDVSATNVLVSVDGAVKLTDFGIAKGFASDGTGTSSSMLVGKPGYMSPEQVRCESLDRRSDVFCIGILLYEMTTGRRCFFGDSVFAVLNATQRAQYVPPSERKADYPAELEAIIARALQADPNERYASARELQSALEEFALDHRIRTSDTVIADYIATLDLELSDPASFAPQTPASGTSMRESGGTEFMLSGGVPVEPLRQHTEVAPSPASPSRRGPLLAGVALGLLAIAGLLVAQPWADEAPDAAEPDAPQPVVIAPEPKAAPEPEPMPEPEPEPEPVAPAPDVGTPVATPDPSPPKTKKRRKKKSRKKSKKPSALDNLVPPSRRKG
ncbi:MAG: serine/threonine protein kinase [Nannocystaceae bacterium]|nr:serine/threonine protein kinase [bacterium]